ncbi:MAG: tetratricopeptide repeat protein, partial [Candidatus Margulisbacteria bacterium]|nr:tetratricopeptide repeat protein [Candidatus Margulisiibacteriota bacterium]
MRRTAVWVALIFILAGCVYAIDGEFNQDNLSLKAGPTEPGEKLSLPWIESFVYPKQVREERIISLGVRTASKIKEVSAAFDFDKEQVKLTSSDGLSWSGTAKIPAGAPVGAHIVRYYIADRRGSIQRTVEFFIELPAPAGAVSSVSRGEVAQGSGWPLTVISSCVAYSNNAVRNLRAGQVLVSLSKMPWYKVMFEDGKEGWVPASYVKEPTDDYYLQGYGSYKIKDYPSAVRFYQKALAVDPKLVKGYLWLAKSYLAQGELDLASEAVRQALRLDDRDLESRVVADTLAQKLYLGAHAKLREGRLYEAVAGFRKTLELKPNSLTAWLEIGQGYQRLGFEAEARDAWREALKIDPENKTIRALLGSEMAVAAADRPARTALAETKPAGGIKNNVAPMVADDSLQILKKEKTSKGTRIEAAIKSVVALTKSLGTPIAEKGWQIKKQGEKFLVSYLCEQSGGALESFDWLVDV